MKNKLTLEELQEQFVKLQEEMQTIKSENLSLKDENEKSKQRQKDLEEHNQKLFLRVTNNIETSENEEKEEEKEIVDFVGADLYKKLNKKEVNLLNDILKGEDE